jgi:hypothetical protein
MALFIGGNGDSWHIYSKSSSAQNESNATNSGVSAKTTNVSECVGFLVFYTTSTTERASHIPALKT